MDHKAVWREQTRRWAIAQLGRKCAHCGATEGLEFDHVDPLTKLVAISVAIRDGWSRRRISEELEKCQLLCGPCHDHKTVAAGENPGGQNRVLDPQHGTQVMYAKPHLCRCPACRAWKADYRRGLVDARGGLPKARRSACQVENRSSSLRRHTMR